MQHLCPGEWQLSSEPAAAHPPPGSAEYEAEELRPTLVSKVVMPLRHTGHTEQHVHYFSMLQETRMNRSFQNNGLREAVCRFLSEQSKG